MGYRDDFYCATNLIGYTGALNDFPTVYFWKPSTGEFGHITQKHDVTSNVGREPVMVSNGGYRAVNEDVTDETGKVVTVLKEYSGDRLFHTSRHEFIPKDGSSEGTLLQALTRCPNEKPFAILRDFGDGKVPKLGIEARALGAPKDALGRRGAVSAGATIRIP
jgi:hypothetical protein